MKNLSSHWSDFFAYCHRPPYIHRKDRERFDGYPHLRDQLNFDGFIKSKRFDPKDEHFHFSLLPVPYAGNLEKSDIFILLLNPGFAPSDYHGEYQHRDFKKALQQNLEQDFRGVEYPFLYLNPRFCWHGAYRWWEAKLRSIVQEVANEQYEGRYLNALKSVSRRVSAIELVPYHSAHFRGGAKWTNLPSAQAAKTWVHNSLAPRAKNGEIVIVVTRKIDVWGIKPLSKRIVCYDGLEARAAHLTSNSRGGAAILERMRAGC